MTSIIKKHTVKHKLNKIENINTKNGGAFAIMNHAPNKIKFKDFSCAVILV